MSSPSTQTSPSRAAARTTSSEVIGVGQLPGVSEVMSVTLGPRRPERDTRPNLPDPSGRGDYRPTHACPHHVDPPPGDPGPLRFDGGEQAASAGQAGVDRQARLHRLPEEVLTR